MVAVTSLDALRSGGVLRGNSLSMRAFVTGRFRSERDEVLYILERDEGIYLPAGEELELGEKLTVISVCGPTSVGRPAKAGPHTVRLQDAPIQRTSDRWYRELIQGEITQFVGSIPPGRAPDHFHLYEEVLCILQGSGFLWAGTSKTPIGPGSCVLLPRREAHCLENTTSGELRLLGVFYPAGSPAVRYEVDQRADGAPAGGEGDRRR